MSDSERPHRWQPTRLPHPWDSPGKNTGVGCQFLLQCMKVKSESEVDQSCPTLATPWTAAYQAPLSMGFSSQKYWSRVPLHVQIFATPCSIQSMEFSRQDTGVRSVSLLQRILPTHESNRGLLHCRHILYQLSYNQRSNPHPLHRELRDLTAGPPGKSQCS